MNGIIRGNKETVAYIVESMIRAKQEQNEIESYILREFLKDVVRIKIKQKELSCRMQH